MSCMNCVTCGLHTLHFHVPQLFDIYDTRAVEALRLLGGLVCRAGKGAAEADNEYRNFAEKCLLRQQYVDEQYGVSLSPRELDNLLLQVHEQKPNLAVHRTPNYS